jgi:hypothetical protein
MADVLIKYTKKFRPNANIRYIHADEKGTCSGIRNAIKMISEGDPVAVIWSDLVLLEKQDSLKFDNNEVFIGLTSLSCSFECRWKIADGKLIEEKNFENGVAGLFCFRDVSCISDIPKSGSLTDYLQKKNWSTFYIKSVLDIGTRSAFEKYQKNNRYFNDVSIKESTVEKKAVVKEYEKLISDEIDWYRHMVSKGFDRIPKIFSENPYIMSRIIGVNPFLKKPNDEFFDDAIRTIERVHNIETQPSDKQELREVYINKTIQRVNLVKEVVPFIENDFITINGEKISNPFSNDNITSFIEEIENVLLNNDINFCLIHGDCTFSNIISSDNKCFLIESSVFIILRF